MNNSSHHNQELVNLLSTYFSQRGKFLAKVIKADLKNSSLKQYRQQAEVIKLNSHQTPVIAPTVEPETHNNSETQSPTESIQKILIDLIIEQTGYPPESITLEAKLLDDLNLDSIKSAEVVAQTAKQIGLEGQIDPSLFANATLQEVINSLQQIQETGNVESATSSINTTSPDNPWVRNFVVEYIPESEESSNPSQHQFPVDDWANSEVLIVANTRNRALAKSLAQELKHRAAKVKIVDLKKLEELSSNNYTHIIAIIPPKSKRNISVETRLEKAVKQLRTVGAFPVQRTQGYTSVSYIQFGDGYFGKGKNLGTIDTNCTIGFAASLHLERADLKVRVIDLPSQIESDLLAELVIEEIARPNAYLAVGFDNELTRLIPRPCLMERTTYKDRNISWSKEDVVLVTGGAKGITAECTLAWAQQTGVSLALVGSSPHPQVNPSGKSSAEISETLKRFQAAGLTCNYYQCDVSDKDALTGLIALIQQELGTVTGVIHGAAINRAKPVNKSSVADAIAEVKPKIMGAMNLAQIFQETPLKLFAGFSSIGAVVGLPGNTWYSFSNEALDLILRDYKQQHPDTEIISIAYSVWSEVGMGAKMGAVCGLARMVIGAISLKDGVERFVQLMEQDPGNAQVVIAARIDGRISLQHNFDTWVPLRVSPPKSFKFLEEILMNEPGVETIARTHLTLTKDSYVQDHIYKGSYLFPTVFGLEAMAQTVAYTLGIDSFTSLRLENIRLERPIVVHPENGIDIEIHAEVTERVTDSTPLTVQVEIRSESTGFTKAHFAADFVLETGIEPKTHEISQPLTPLDIEPKKDLYGWLLFQGAKFQRIQEIYSLDSRQMVFLTEQQDLVKENNSDRAYGSFLLGDPYYRDSLLHSVQPIVPEDLCLPLRIQSIEIHLTVEKVENYCIGIATREQTENNQHDTTVMVVNRNGQVIEKLEGYQIKIMEHSADNPTAEELANPETRDQQLLYQELNQRAKALGIVPPQVTMTYLPDNFSLEQKQELFSHTVNQLLNSSNEQLNN